MVSKWKDEGNLFFLDMIVCMLKLVCFFMIFWRFVNVYYVENNFNSWKYFVGFYIWGLKIFLYMDKELEWMKMSLLIRKVIYLLFFNF